MNVRSETTIQNRTISVELTDQDVSGDIPNWSQLPLSKRFTILSLRTDMCVVLYLKEAHLIDPDTYTKRMTVLASKLKDLA